MYQLFLLFSLFSYLAKAESNFDLLKYSIVKVESIYLDEATQKPISIFGVGTLIHTIDTKNESHWIVVTTSHISQGTLGTKISLIDNPGYTNTQTTPKDEFLEIEFKNSHPWRLANNTQDLEAIVVKVPKSIENLSKKYEVSVKIPQADETILKQFTDMKLSIFLKYFEGIPEIFSALRFDQTDSSKNYIMLSNKAFIPVADFLHKKAKNLSSVMATEIDPTSYSSLLFPWALGFGYRNWQKENVFQGPVVKGFSGTPVFEFGKPRLTGLVKGFHKYMPKTYTIDAELIRELINNLLKKNSSNFFTDSTRWHMYNRNTFRTYGAKNEYSEVNPYLSSSEESFYHKLVNSGGHSTADTGGHSTADTGDDNSAMKIKNLNMTNDLKAVVSPGLTYNFSGKSKNILAFKLNEGTVYADWDSKQWVKILAKQKNLQIVEIPYPPNPDDINKLVMQRAKRSLELWKLQSDYFTEFWKQSEDKISWTFEQMFGIIPNQNSLNRRTILPMCKVRKVTNNKNFQIQLLIQNEMEPTTIEINHLGQPINQKNIIPYSSFTQNLSSGQTVLIDPNGLYFLDFKQVDRFNIYYNKNRTGFAWPYSETLLKFPDFFGNENGLCMPHDGANHTGEMKKNLVMNSEKSTVCEASRLGNIYFEGAYITLKTSQDQTGWPITCILEE